MALPAGLSRLAPAGALVAVVLVAQPSAAQLPAAPRIVPELRADLITGDRAAVQAGGGVHVPAGYYVRIGVVAAGGVSVDDPFGSGPGTHRRASGRVDLLARFLLDPFRQTRYGLSVGGGVSLRADEGERGRVLLLVAVDVEGRRSARGLVPALQVGLGGGGRVGIILRYAASTGYR